MADDATNPAGSPQTVLLLNRLALAHMLPYGGNVKFSLLDQAALKALAAGKEVKALVVYDPMIAMIGGMDPEQFSAWFVQVAATTTGSSLKATDEPLQLKAGAPAILAEIDLVPTSEIDIPGQPNVRVVTHWYRLDVSEAFEKPGPSLVLK